MILLLVLVVEYFRSVMSVEVIEDNRCLCQIIIVQRFISSQTSTNMILTTLAEQLLLLCLLLLVELILLFFLGRLFIVFGQEANLLLELLQSRYHARHYLVVLLFTLEPHLLFLSQFSQQLPKNGLLFTIHASNCELHSLSVNHKISSHVLINFIEQLAEFGWGLILVLILVSGPRGAEILSF